jgi:hypothetical protein
MREGTSAALRSDAQTNWATRSVHPASTLQHYSRYGDKHADGIVGTGPVQTAPYRNQCRQLTSNVPAETS